MLAQSPLPFVAVLNAVVTELEDAQSNEDTTKRTSAITTLCDLVDKAYGEDAALLGEFLRECGGIELLLECVSDDIPEVQYRALMVLGNLASAAVDPHAQLTKAAINELDGASVLLPLLESDDWVTQMYAVGAVQNLADDASFCNVYAQRGTHRVLQRLLSSEHEHVVRFAAGALKNLMDNLEEQDAAREAEQTEPPPRLRSPFALLSRSSSSGERPRKKRAMINLTP